MNPVTFFYLAGLILLWWILAAIFDSVHDDDHFSCP